MVTESLDDAADITHKDNSLCDEMNDLLFYFGNLGHVMKQKLMYSFLWQRLMGSRYFNCARFVYNNYRGKV